MKPNISTGSRPHVTADMIVAAAQAADLLSFDYNHAIEDAMRQLWWADRRKVVASIIAAPTGDKSAISHLRRLWPTLVVPRCDDCGCRVELRGEQCIDCAGLSDARAEADDEAAEMAQQYQIDRAQYLLEQM